MCFRFFCIHCAFIVHDSKLQASGQQLRESRSRADTNQCDTAVTTAPAAFLAGEAFATAEQDSYAPGGTLQSLTTLTRTSVSSMWIHLHSTTGSLWEPQAKLVHV